MVLNLTIIICGLILTALFTTFEAALVSSDPLKIYAQVKDRNKLKRLMQFFQNPGQVINSLIVAINIVDITVAMFVLKSFQLFFPIVEAAIYATIFSVLVTLVFGEIIPKAVAVSFPRFIILNFFMVIQVFVWFTRPFVFLLNKITSVLYPKLWKENGAAPIVRSEVELLFHQNRNLHSQHLVEMIYRVLSIDNIRIKEAKIPISEVVGLDREMTVKEFKAEVIEDYYSRFPIYNEDIFDIIGYVESKDIFFAQDEEQFIENFRRKAMFFPENKAVDDVIEEMEAQHIPLAFVVDEFGAVAGMVTKKDLTELIIGGSAQDERHLSKSSFIKTYDGWIVSGRQDVDELNDRIALGIEKDGFETLAGFAMFELKTIPKVGDSFVYKGFTYHVREMQGFFVSKVEISHQVFTNASQEDNELLAK